MAEIDLTNVLVSVLRTWVGYLGEIRFSFTFPSLPVDYFDVQDLKNFTRSHFI